MASTAAELDPRLIAFVLPSIPESARMARFHIRAALGFHGLDEYADDAEAITSELVTNADAPRGALLYPRCSRGELKGGSRA
jgi:hypothetical protein